MQGRLGFHYQINTQTIGKGFGEQIFKTIFAATILKIGGRAIDSQHMEFAIGLNFFEVADPCSTGNIEQKYASRQD